jgi:hypothetical protein
MWALYGVDYEAALYVVRIQGQMRAGEVFWLVVGLGWGSEQRARRQTSFVQQSQMLELRFRALASLA